MKTIATVLTALTLTAITLYTFAPSTQPSTSKLLVGADKGYLYDVKVCGTNNYNLSLVSFTNAEPVKSRSNVHMNLKFKGNADGAVESMKLSVSKVIPLFSQTYTNHVEYKAGEEATFSNVFSIPMIPISTTVDIQATLQDGNKKDLLTICAKLDI